MILPRPSFGTARCSESAFCIELTEGEQGVAIRVAKDACEAATERGGYEIIRGRVDGLTADATRIDLGETACVAAQVGLAATDIIAGPDPRCVSPAAFYLARPVLDADFGNGSAGLPRTPGMDVCP